MSTKKNSKGACSHDVVSNRVIPPVPPRFATSVRVAPRLKKPSTPAVNNEKAMSNRPLVLVVMGGVQCTLPIMSGYAKESVTGMQLFKKTSNINAIWPKANVARTGLMIRDVIRSNRNVRNAGEAEVTSTPAREPRAKATRVAPNALSTSFMVDASRSTHFDSGVR